MLPFSPNERLIAIACVLPLLPKSVLSTIFVNRGYTVWYHVTLLLTLLTRSKFLKRLVTVMGITVCLGWYGSLIYEYLVHGRFFDVLYDNAEVLFDLKESETCSKSCAGVRKLAVHVADFVAHPFPLVILIGSKPFCVSEYNEWSSTLAALVLSRAWSIFHNVYNLGLEGHSWLWYCSTHVYNINTVEAWKYAYIAEGLTFGYFFKELYSRKGSRGGQGEGGEPRRSRRLAAKVK